jgi:hypothetical protein
VKRVGIFHNEITGGPLESSAAWVNDSRALDTLIERGGSFPTSMLRQAVEIGSDSSELAQVIIAARNTVKVPKRLQTITKRLEDAETVYRQEHAAEIEADVANARKLHNRSRASRLPWVLPRGSSERGDSPAQNTPPRKNEPDD